MIRKWRLTPTVGNFGDELSDVLLNVFVASSQKKLIESDEGYHLIGSTISDHWLDHQSNMGQPTHFWGCGYRNEELSSKYLASAQFHGVRGHLTHNFLKQYGHQTKVVGDTAMLLPLLVKKAPATNKRIFMPHILDPDRYHYHAEDLKVDQIIQPDVQDPQDIYNIINALSGASFVLAGAMHAGIVAHAYNRPFGFFRREFVDCQHKYADFLSSIGVNQKTKFATDFSSAQRWHKAQRSQFRPVRLRNILKYAPAKIKPKVIIQSAFFDANTTFARSHSKG